MAAWSITLVACIFLTLTFLSTRFLVRATFLVSTSLAAGLHAVSLGVFRANDVSAFSQWAATASFVWGVVAACIPSSRSFTDEGVDPRSGWVELSRTASLWFGAVAGVAVSFLLVLRTVHVVVETIWCVPWFPVERYGYAPDGLVSLGFLLGSHVVAWVSTRDRRLAVGVFWTAVAAASWYCLLDPVLALAPSGGFARTPTTLSVTCAWAGLLFIGAVMAVVAPSSHRMKAGATVVQAPSSTGSSMSTSVGALAFGLALPIWFHLLVPIGGMESVALSSISCATLAACLAAIGCYVLLMRDWNGLLADALLGMVTQAICGVAVAAATAWAAGGDGAVLPGSPPLASLSERFPLVFSAMMGGLALASGWFTWLAGIWRPQLDDGRPWTTEGRLISHLGRFTFLNIALALVVGAVLTFWPHQPTVSSSDDTLGRVIGGLAAHLLVVLVTLAAARRWRRPTLRILSVVAMGSTAVFLAVRIWPFRSHIS